MERSRWLKSGTEGSCRTRASKLSDIFVLRVRWGNEECAGGSGDRWTGGFWWKGRLQLDLTATVHVTGKKKKPRGRHIIRVSQHVLKYPTERRLKTPHVHSGVFSSFAWWDVFFWRLFGREQMIFSSNRLFFLFVVRHKPRHCLTWLYWLLMTDIL